MNWEPFAVLPLGVKPEPTRHIQTPEGIGDRLRAAAFAELQAREAFAWAADSLADAPADLRAAWRNLALAEESHLDMLLGRMSGKGVDIRERPVSTRLWHSLRACGTAEEFARFMAASEERGRQAGKRFCKAMAKTDPETAALFGRIAREEAAHIALAYRFFPDPAKESLIPSTHSTLGRQPGSLRPFFQGENTSRLR